MPRREDPRGPLFPRFPRPDLEIEIPGGFDDLIFNDSSKESCADCRSRQDPNVMNIVDPCRNQCSGGAGDVSFEVPDIRFPDRFPESRPRPRSSEYPVDFPRVNSRDRGVNDALIPAAQLLGEFLGRLMKPR